MCSNFSKVYKYVDGTGKPFFFVCGSDIRLSVLRMELETEVAVNMHWTSAGCVCVLKCLNSGNVLDRDLLHEKMEGRTCQMLWEHY